MEWLLLFVQGLLIGFVESIAPGPMAMVCIQRTISNGKRSGFASGMGIAFADTLFAAVALLFLGFVLSFVEKNMHLITLVSGICIMILGLHIFFKNPVTQLRSRQFRKKGFWGDFLSVFFITLTNPAIMLIFLALLATFGISQSGLTVAHAICLLAGVLIGTSLWWFTLTSGLNAFRKKFKLRYILYLNRLSGALIVLLGVIAMVSAFF